MEFPKNHQGSAVKLSETNPSDSSELARDAEGITNPNLHRRVDAQQPNSNLGELSPRSYQFTVASRYSYRTTQIHLHEEDSTESELP